MITVIDYGMGNLHSVSKAVERLGCDVVVTSDPEAIMSSAGAILPGVGAFGDAMRHLTETGLKDTVIQYAQSGKPLLGICLGMQLMFSESEEYGHHKGLNLLSGKVVKFKGDYKIPHMGWNRLQFHQQSPILNGLEEGYVYFVHSFHVQVESQSHLIATTNYHQQVTAVVGHRNLYGMQFHPEKSGVLGMQLLHNFLEMAKAEPLEV